MTQRLERGALQLLFFSWVQTPPEARFREILCAPSQQWDIVSMFVSFVLDTLPCLPSHVSLD